MGMLRVDRNSIVVMFVIVSHSVYVLVSHRVCLYSKVCTYARNLCCDLAEPRWSSIPNRYSSFSSSDSPALKLPSSSKVSSPVQSV